MTTTKQAQRAPGASSQEAVCKDGYAFVLTHETKEIADYIDAHLARIAELEDALHTITEAATVGGISAGERKGLAMAAKIARAALKGAA